MNISLILSLYIIRIRVCIYIYSALHCALILSCGLFQALLVVTLRKGADNQEFGDLYFFTDDFGIEGKATDKARRFNFFPPSEIRNFESTVSFVFFFDWWKCDWLGMKLNGGISYSCVDDGKEEEETPPSETSPAAESIVVGYALTSKKKKSFLKQKFIRLARYSSGISFS